MALSDDPYLRLQQRASLLRRTPEVPQATPEALDRVQRSLAADSRGTFGEAVSAGLEDVRASGYTARGLLRLAGGDDAGGVEDVQRAQAITDRAGEFIDAPQRLEDIDGVGGALSYATATVGRLAPQIGLGLVTGGLGGAAQGVAAGQVRKGLLRHLSREAVERGTDDAALAAARTGGVAGAERAFPTAAERIARAKAQPGVQAKILADDFVAKNVTSGAKKGVLASSVVGQTQQAQQTILDPEATGSLQERAAKTGLSALVTGAMDALPITQLLGRYGLGAAAKDFVAKGDIVQRATKHALAQGFAEGSTELAQSVAERATHKWVNDNVEVIGPDAFSDYLNAAAAGVIGGGVFGAPAGLRGSSKDSPAIGRMREALTSVGDKLKAGRTKLTPDPTPRPAAGEKVAEGEPIDLGSVGAAVQQAAAFVEGIKGAATTKLKDVVSKFDQTATSLDEVSTIENSIEDILNAEPYQFQTDASGISSFSNNKGLPFAQQFADATRARLYVQKMQRDGQQPNVGLAAVMSTVPEDKVDTLMANGALDAARMALRGELDKVDDVALARYESALPDDAKPLFWRAAATAKTASDNGAMFNEPTEAPADTTAAVEQEIGQLDSFETREVDSDPVKAQARDTIRMMREASGGVLPAGRRPDPNTMVFVGTSKNGKEVRRQVSGQAIGARIMQLRQANPGLKTDAALAQVMTDLSLGGLQVEPESLKAGLKFGRGWMMTPAMMKTLVAGIEGAPTKGTVPAGQVGATVGRLAAERKATAGQRARDLAMDPGAIDPADIVSEVQGESDPRADEVLKLGPRGRRPTDTEAIDAGTIDRDMRREENTVQVGSREAAQRVDAIIKKHTGAVPTNRLERDHRVTQLSKTLRGAERRTLTEHVYDMRRRGMEEADRKLKKLRARADEALAAYKKEKTPATRETLDKARRALAADVGRLEAQYAENKEKLEPVARALGRLRAPEIKKAPTKKVVKKVAKAQKPKALDEDLAIDHSATASAEGIETAVNAAVGTRSRRSLYALRTKLANSTLDAAAKTRLSDKIDAQLSSRRASIHTAAATDQSAAARMNKTPAHFADVRARLEKASTLENALKTVRDVATPAQKRLIDTYLGMRAVRGVPFEVETGYPTSPAGMVGGSHTAPMTTSESFKGRVVLKYSPGEPTGQAGDAIGVLLHEATHAATAYAEQSDPEARKAIEQMLDHARTYARGIGIDPDSFYGLAETQEFIAEAFTNTALQDLLRQIPARNTKKFQSLWNEFKDFVAKLLGFTSEDVTLLDEVMTVGLDMARTSADIRERFFDDIAFAPPTADGLDVQEFSITNTLATPASGSQPTDYMALLGANERRYLVGAFRRGSVIRQIRAKVDPATAARLDTADEGPALLVNAGIALALQGKLDLNGAPKGAGEAFARLWDTISKVLQIPSKTVYARAVLADLKAGKPAAKIDARSTTLKPAALEITNFVDKRIAPKVFAFTRDMDQRMRSTGVPALVQLATLMSQRTGEFRADRTASYTARTREERSKKINQFYKIIGEWDDKRKRAAVDALQAGADTPDASALRKFYRGMYDYMKSANVKGLGETDNYFPIQIDPEAVAANKEDFIKLFAAENIWRAALHKERDMLRKALNAAKAEGATKKQIGWYDKKLTELANATPEEIAERWYNFATRPVQPSAVADLTFAEGDHKPSFRALNNRVMDFVVKLGTPEQKAVFATFQEKSLERITLQYVNRSVRRAEWDRMELDDRIAQLMETAKKQGATPAQMELAGDYVDQVMGSYGSDWHPWIKKITANFGVNLPPFEKFQALNTALITYQNLRLLPLAAMSSLIDPLGVAVRGAGDMKSAFSSYRDALRAIRDKEGNNALMNFASDLGAVERHAIGDTLVYMFGGAGDPTGKAAQWNTTLFKYNGLEWITKYSRLAALANAHRFIAKHAASDDAQSQRYLKELGLTKDDVVIENGFVKRSSRVDQALMRFIDESVVRPHPAQRPGWHNDPHFQLAAQYKGYLYAFWNTVTRRAGVELSNGNMAVLTPLVMYLPVTMLGELVRDMAQGDDEDRDAFDYAKLSVERSGLLGPHVNLLSNARSDVSYGHSVLNSIAGPTGQQLGQAYDATHGERSAGRTAVEALPGSALYEDWL